MPRLPRVVDLPTWRRPFYQGEMSLRITTSRRPGTECRVLNVLSLLSGSLLCSWCRLAHFPLISVIY